MPPPPPPPWQPLQPAPKNTFLPSAIILRIAGIGVVDRAGLGVADHLERRLVLHLRDRRRDRRALGRVAGGGLVHVGFGLRRIRRTRRWSRRWGSTAWGSDPSACRPSSSRCSPAAACRRRGRPLAGRQAPRRGTMQSSSSILQPSWICRLFRRQLREQVEHSRRRAVVVLRGDIARRSRRRRSSRRPWRATAAAARFIGALSRAAAIISGVTPVGGRGIDVGAALDEFARDRRSSPTSATACASRLSGGGSLATTIRGVIFLGRDRLVDPGATVDQRGRGVELLLLYGDGQRRETARRPRLDGRRPSSGSTWIAGASLRSTACRIGAQPSLSGTSTLAPWSSRKPVVSIAPRRTAEVSGV